MGVINAMSIPGNFLRDNSFMGENYKPKPKKNPYLNLRITEEQFKEYYPGMEQYEYIFKEDFKNDIQFIEEYLTSKLWRMNNLYTIIDKDGIRVPFIMNKSQHRVYSAYLKHPRLIILKSRQQGISTFWLLFFFDEALFGEDLNLGLMAQGADEAATLLERVKFSWDNLDVSIKDFLGIAVDKNNAKAFSFTNNSTLFIRTSFRSATLQGMHISELGKIANKNPEKAKETNTGTLQAIKGGNPIAIESTAEGDNMFKTKWDKAWNHEGPLAPKDFLAVFLSWLDDPDCWLDIPQKLTKEDEEYFLELEDELGYRIADEQKWFWVMQKRELDDSGADSDIFQEYPSTPEEAFSAVRSGSYYAKQVRKHLYEKKRIVPNLYDENLPVDVCVDLGMDDEFIIGFWQYYDKKERLVHEYRNSGEGLEFYVEYINKVARERGYKIGVFTGPHDLKVKELGTGLTRKKRLQELGVRKIRVLKKDGIADGIEAVRRMIPNLWIDESCTYHIACLMNYSKEWDAQREVWKEKPLHNDWSHGADQIRYRAMSNGRYSKDTIVKEQEKTRRKSTGVVGGLCL